MKDEDILQIIIKNLHGETIHVEAIAEETVMDIFRGVSETNQLYSLTIEINSLKPIQTWKEEEEE